MPTRRQLFTCKNVFFSIIQTFCWLFGEIQSMYINLTAKNAIIYFYYDSYCSFSKNIFKNHTCLYYCGSCFGSWQNFSHLNRYEASSCKTSHMQPREGLMAIGGVLDNFSAWVTLGNFRLNPSIALPKWLGLHCPPLVMTWNSSWQFPTDGSYPCISGRRPARCRCPVWRYAI